MSYRTITGILIILLAIFTGGCAKKARHMLLKKPLQHSYRQTRNNITLQVSYVSPKQFKKIYPKGLGKYALLDEHESYTRIKSAHRKEKKRARLLQGTIKNSTSKVIYISHEGISLPVIPPHKAYKKCTFLRNFSFGWLGFWGPLGLWWAYAAFAAPFFVGLAIADLTLAVPGAIAGTVEHLKILDRKEFAYTTMLQNTPHSIQPHEEFSWLMMIPHDKYSQQFTITCTDENAQKHIFSVSMNHPKNNRLALKCFMDSTVSA